MLTKLFTKLSVKELPLEGTYMPLSLFNKKFNRSKSILGKGTHGQIIVCIDSKYVVKIIDHEDDGFTTFIRELNIYSKLSHPCIIEMIAWSFDYDKGYIAFSQGIPIVDAYVKEIISIEKIMADTLSAIAFMNSNGIGHCDIKPCNIIFHKGNAKIIDMGLCRKYILGENGTYYTKQDAYTPTYKDPEYYENSWNSISCEIYALAATYYSIAEQTCLRRSELYKFRSKNTTVNWFLDHALVFQNERKDIHWLADNFPHRIEYIGTVNIEPMYVIPRRYDNLYKSTLIFITKTACKNNFVAEVVFLSLHTFHRCVDKIFPHENVTKQDLRLLGMACIDIASRVCLNEKDIFGDYELKNMIVQVLRVCDGIINSFTYWDYAKSAKDLPALLKNTLNFNYDVNKIIDLQVGNTKYGTAGTLWSKTLKKIYMNEVYKNTHDSKINTCILDFTKNPQDIIKVWTENTNEILGFSDVRISILLHHRSVLALVDKKSAVKIYEWLNSWGPSTFELRDLICKFDWRNTQSTDPFGIPPLKIDSQVHL